MTNTKPNPEVVKVLDAFAREHWACKNWQAVSKNDCFNYDVIPKLATLAFTRGIELGKKKERERIIKIEQEYDKKIDKRIVQLEADVKFWSDKAMQLGYGRGASKMSHKKELSK